MSTSRHSAGGQILRTSAAQNILNSSRVSQTESKGFNAGRRTSSEAFGKNTAVITLDELQRIRAQCTQNPFGSSFAGGSTAGGYTDMDDDQQRLRDR